MPSLYFTKAVNKGNSSVYNQQGRCTIGAATKFVQDASLPKNSTMQACKRKPMKVCNISLKTDLHLHFANTQTPISRSLYLAMRLLSPFILHLCSLHMDLLFCLLQWVLTQKFFSCPKLLKCIYNKNFFQFWIEWKRRAPIRFLLWSVSLGRFTPLLFLKTTITCTESDGVSKIIQSTNRSRVEIFRRRP